MREGPAPMFDPSRTVAFDLERGHVSLSDGEPHLLVPVGPLLSLFAGELDPRQLGRHVGVGLVGRMAKRFAHRGGTPRDAIRASTLETIVDLLGGELALLGVGNLRVERWGSAMLFVLDPCALDARADALLAGIFEGALTSVSEREVAAVVVDRSGEIARVLVGSMGAMARAEAMARRGAFFTEIVSALHAEAAERSGDGTP